MRAAIYARYSSENQRKESIDDQFAACRRHAADNELVVLEDHVYADYAQSGASLVRPALQDLLANAKGGQFDVVLVDDLSRLARANLYMLEVLADLQYRNVSVIAVADRLDSSDPDAMLGIQLRGIFNQLQLSDLTKKTIRGQLGQKARGFDVGERTYGYSSIPCGEMRIDKRGSPRPDGHKKLIDPAQAVVIRRIFDEFAARVPQNRIVIRLNEEGVPHVNSRALGWNASTVHRILHNQKYIGRWVWNRTGGKRDPHTGARRRFLKPESEHVVTLDESLRIIPQELWDAVRAQEAEVSGVWPGGHRRGFSSAQGSRSKVYPTHLLDGILCCASCGNSIGLVGGTRGGYYGCGAAKRRVCDNHLTVCRSKVERIFLRALRDRLLEPGVVSYALRRVADEVARLAADVPEMLGRKQAELTEVRKRLNQLVDFVARGEASDSRAVGAAIAEAEARVSRLDLEVAALSRSDGPLFELPSETWIAERVAALQELLERRTAQSAHVLRRLLGEVVLEPVKPESGRSYYVARTVIDTLVLREPSGPAHGPDEGSGSLRWWRRRESNPRPKVCLRGTLHACPPLNVSLPVSKDGENRRKPAPKSLAGACRHHARRPARYMTFSPDPQARTR